MQNQEYLRSFDLPTEVLGWVKWSKLDFLSRVHHACDAKAAGEIIRSSTAAPRSTVDYTLKGAPRQVRGLWTTLNDYSDGYDFGPIRFTWDTAVLDSRKFLVVQRDKDRQRFTFLEYEHDTSLRELVTDDLFVRTPN